jgi:hypothetical protein
LDYTFRRVYPEKVAPTFNLRGLRLLMIASGKTLDDAAKTCPELREAMELWGKVKFEVAD